MLNNINENQELVAETLDGLATSALFNPLNKKSKDNQMLVSKKPNINKKISAKFKLIKNDQEIYSTLIGQQAKTLIALIEAKENGITALSISSWALRLASYIHILRSKYNLDISTINEPHEGGNHGKYHLHNQIEILETTKPSKSTGEKNV